MYEQTMYENGALGHSSRASHFWGWLRRERRGAAEKGP